LNIGAARKSTFSFCGHPPNTRVYLRTQDKKKTQNSQKSKKEKTDKDLIANMIQSHIQAARESNKNN
jgi:hypothetical protein